MGITIRKRGGKWYVFVNHNGLRKAKCVGVSRKTAEEVRRQLPTNGYSFFLPPNHFCKVSWALVPCAGEMNLATAAAAAISTARSSE